jgi:hypothetical protein
MWLFQTACCRLTPSYVPCRLQVFYSTFVYYSNGGNDPYHMSLNAFTTLLDDAGIPDPDSLSIKRSDCDTIFIVCNFQPDKSSPDVAVNDEHAMMRFEFMECIVRLGEPQQSAAMMPVVLRCTGVGPVSAGV